MANTANNAIAQIDESSRRITPLDLSEVISKKDLAPFFAFQGLLERYNANFENTVTAEDAASGRAGGLSAEQAGDLHDQILDSYKEMFPELATEAQGILPSVRDAVLASEMQGIADDLTGHHMTMKQLGRRHKTDGKGNIVLPNSAEPVRAAEAGHRPVAEPVQDVVTTNSFQQAPSEIPPMIEPVAEQQKVVKPATESIASAEMPTPVAEQPAAPPAVIETPQSAQSIEAPTASNTSDGVAATEKLTEDSGQALRGPGSWFSLRGAKTTDRYAEIDGSEALDQAA